MNFKLSLLGIFFSVILVAQNNPTIKFEGKTYTVYSFFDTDINKLLHAIKYSDQVSDGNWIVPFPGTQKPAYLFSIIDGKLEGQWTSYYKTGLKKLSGIYSNNKKEKLWKSWHPSGKAMEESVFLDDGFYRMVNRWDINGTPTVTNGLGKYFIEIDGATYIATVRSGIVISQEKYEPKAE